MNKLELIDTLRFEAEITKSEAAAVVDLFFNEMANALAKNDRIKVPWDIVEARLLLAA